MSDPVQRLDDRLRDAEGRVTRVETAQSGHEALCADRYKNILDGLNGVGGRVSGVEKTIARVGWAAIVGLLGVVATLIGVIWRLSAIAPSP